ncbi:MAG TPA: hypothetical protein VHT50_12865 [Mycobacterium sp.]|jgi:hypothetical protein|nr:hypothetical protein [Mycobacterium sp.]
MASFKFAPDELVFPCIDGGYLPRPKLSRGWFAGAVKRAKVQKITPHDLKRGRPVVL